MFPNSELVAILSLWAWEDIHTPCLLHQMSSVSALFTFRTVFRTHSCRAVHCMLFSCIPVFYSLDASSSSPVMVTKDASKHCPLSPGASGAAKLSRSEPVVPIPASFCAGCSPPACTEVPLALLWEKVTFYCHRRAEQVCGPFVQCSVSCSPHSLRSSGLEAATSM